MSQLAPGTEEMLNSLRAAVAETLERKRRLGHYAVTWKDGKPELAGGDAPESQNAAPHSKNSSTS